NPADPDSKIEFIYLAPMICVQLERAYHATRVVSIDSILKDGLLPGNSERQTTEDRCDCEGNVYLCEKLGALEDADIKKSFSAHWWRAELATKSRFKGYLWGILEVDIGKVPGAKVYKDIWSQSGLIVGGVDFIPPGDHIRVAYRPDS